ncbi:protein kinase [Nonomuraea sp. NPDC059194]|uniref:serine/threonine-protein kinase n=1 Tax=Nonomuraea sp. NPDC059194 TaxID=3346764 RepID=UPI0036CDD4BF
MPHVAPLRHGDPAAIGAYLVVGRLGEGGQGVVYLGRAPDGRPVAIKVLREGVAPDDRFAREIAAARRVEPFCVAQVLDASLSGRPYIVTEYIDGPTLQQAGRHSGAELQRLAVATATALAAIHQAGVVHRDFKPANVLLGPGGPRVIDFGIARAADAGATVTSSVVGTPAYMAPEQLAGAQVESATDVFAWASVMVWAATGAPPFGEDTLPAIINRILHNEPQLGDLQQPLRSIVHACLAKDPAHRPTMRDVLLRLIGGGAPEEHTAPAHGRPRARRGRVVIPVIAGSAVVASAALVAVVVSRLPAADGMGSDPLLAAVTTAVQTPEESTSMPARRVTPGTKKTRKATRSPRPAATDKPTPTSRPTTARPTSTAEPSTSTRRTAPATRKPAVSARVSILPFAISGGPGQSEADGCYKPPVHFQTDVESSKKSVWISYQWIVDGKVVTSGKSWVPDDAYTAFVTAPQYMLKEGSHRIGLRVTSPGTASRNASIDVCSVEY